MSKAIGEVSRIDGEFIVKAGDGTLKLLAPGTLLYEDDVIQGRGGSRELEIQLTNGDTKIIGGDEMITLSESVITKEPPMPEERQIDPQQVVETVHSGEWVVNVDPELVTGEIEPEHFVARAFLEHDTMSSEPSLGLNPNTPDALGGVGVTGVVPEAVSAASSVESTASAVATDVPVNPAAEAQAAAEPVDVAEAPTLSHMSVEGVRTITEVHTVVDVEATEAAGIHERDGHYYKTETHEVATNAVDVAALKNMGYTLGSDGHIYTINTSGAKVQIEQEATKVISKVVATDPIMKMATESTTVMVAGNEIEQHPGTIAKNTSQTIDLGASTKNIEIAFNAFNQGSVKIEFLKDGQVIHSENQSHAGNNSIGYGFGQEFDAIRLSDHGQDIQIKSITGREAAQEVTVDAGGLVPDTEAMQAAGITWVDTVSKTIVQTPTNTGSEVNDLQNIGNVGNNDAKGFNPEDREVSQVFDFGASLAHQKVSVTVNLTVSGSWDYNAVSTHDIMTVSANGEPLETYNYTSSNSDYNSAVARGESVEKIGAKTYTYDVILDENGQAQLDFMVASTATDEVVNVQSITAHYEGFTGYVHTVQETQTYMETVFVDAPSTLVDPADIEGGVPMVMENQTVEVPADPIMTTQEDVVGYEYDISYHVGLTDTDGSETLGNLTLSNLPEGAQLHDANGETIAPNEDGSYTIDTQADSTVSMTLVSTHEIASEQLESVSASITSTEGDGESTATITVTGDTESIDFSGLSQMADNSDTPSENPLSEEISLGQIFTLDQDPNVALFEEDVTSNNATPVNTDTAPSSTPSESSDFYVDNSDAGLVVEQPVEVAAT